jgi:hypothetical protein
VSDAIGNCRRCDTPVPASSRIDWTITLEVSPDQDDQEILLEQKLKPGSTVKCVSYVCPGCRSVVCKPDNGGEHFNLQAENAAGELEFVEQPL